MRSGFTLVEILVTIVIIALLAALLIPAARIVSEKAKISESTSNVRQIGIFTQLYTQDANGLMPHDISRREGYWMAELWDIAYPGIEFPGWKPDSRGHVLSGTIFHSPLQESIAADGRDSRSYGWSKRLRPNFGHPNPRFSRVKYPTKTILLSDSKSSSAINSDGSQINYRNNGKAIFLFIDGHVELRTPPEVPLDNEHVFWGGDQLEINPDE